MATNCVADIGVESTEEIVPNECEEESQPSLLFEILMQLEQKENESITERVNLLVNGWSVLVSDASDLPEVSEAFYSLFRETAHTVFKTKWNLVEDSLKQQIITLLQETGQKLNNLVDGALQLSSALVETAVNPWGESILRKLLKGEVLPSDSDAKQYLLSQPKLLLLAQVEFLVSSGHEDAALRLCQCCLKSHWPPNGNAKGHYCREGDYPPDGGGDYCGIGLDSNCSSGKDVVGTKQAFWIWMLRILHRKHQLRELVKETTQCMCHDGVQLIHRIKDGCLVDSGELAETLTQLFLVRDLLYPSTYCCTKELISLWCEFQVSQQRSFQDISLAARKLLVLHASTSAHFYLFVDILWKHFGSELLPLYLEMYIRGLTADLNYLEEARYDEDLGKITELKCHIAAVFSRLATLFIQNRKELARECVISAFSMEPTHERLELLRRLTDWIALKKMAFGVTSNKTTGSQWQFVNHNIGDQLDGQDARLLLNCPQKEFVCCRQCSSPTEEIEFLKSKECEEFVEKFTHPVIDAKIQGVSDELLKDFATVLECMRYNLLQGRDRWEDMRKNCEEYLETALAMRTMLQYNNMYDSADSETDSPSEDEEVSQIPEFPSQNEEVEEVQNPVGVRVVRGVCMVDQTIQTSPVPPEDLYGSLYVSKRRKTAKHNRKSRQSRERSHKRKLNADGDGSVKEKVHKKKKRRKSKREKDRDLSPDQNTRVLRKSDSHKKRSKKKLRLQQESHKEKNQSGDLNILEEIAMPNSDTCKTNDAVADKPNSGETSAILPQTSIPLSVPDPRLSPSSKPIVILSDIMSSKKLSSKFKKSINKYKKLNQGKPKNIHMHKSWKSALHKVKINNKKGSLKRLVERKVPFGDGQKSGHSHSKKKSGAGSALNTQLIHDTSSSSSSSSSSSRSTSSSSDSYGNVDINNTVHVPDPLSPDVEVSRNSPTTCERLETPAVPQSVPGPVVSTSQMAQPSPCIPHPGTEQTFASDSCSSFPPQQLSVASNSAANNDSSAPLDSSASQQPVFQPESFPINPPVSTTPPLQADPSLPKETQPKTSNPQISFFPVNLQVAGGNTTPLQAIFVPTGGSASLSGSLQNALRTPESNNQTVKITILKANPGSVKGSSFGLNTTQGGAPAVTSRIPIYANASQAVNAQGNSQAAAQSLHASALNASCAPLGISNLGGTGVIAGKLVIPLAALSNIRALLNATSVAGSQSQPSQANTGASQSVGNSPNNSPPNTGSRVIILKAPTPNASGVTAPSGSSGPSTEATLPQQPEDVTKNGKGRKRLWTTVRNTHGCWEWRKVGNRGSTEFAKPKSQKNAARHSVVGAVTLKDGFRLDGSGGKEIPNQPVASSCTVVGSAALGIPQAISGSNNLGTASSNVPMLQQLPTVGVNLASNNLNTSQSTMKPCSSEVVNATGISGTPATISLQHLVSGSEVLGQPPVVMGQVTDASGLKTLPTGQVNKSQDGCLPTNLNCPQVAQRSVKKTVKKKKPTQKVLQQQNITVQQQTVQPQSIAGICPASGNVVSVPATQLVQQTDSVVLFRSQQPALQNVTQSFQVVSGESNIICQQPCAANSVPTVLWTSASTGSVTSSPLLQQTSAVITQTPALSTTPVVNLTPVVAAVTLAPTVLQQVPVQNIHLQSVVPSQLQQVVMPPATETNVSQLQTFVSSQERSLHAPHPHDPNVHSRSLSSISDAVRVSLMMTDENSGGLENQMPSTYQTYPQHNTVYSAQDGTNTVPVSTSREEASIQGSQILLPSSFPVPQQIPLPNSEVTTGGATTFTSQQCMPSTTTWSSPELAAIANGQSKVTETKSKPKKKPKKPKETTEDANNPEQQQEAKKKKKSAKREKDPTTGEECEKAMRKWWCDPCKRGFFSAYNLRRHQKNVHKMDCPSPRGSMESLLSPRLSLSSDSQFSPPPDPSQAQIVMVPSSTPLESPPTTSEHFASTTAETLYTTSTQVTSSIQCTSSDVMTTQYSYATECSVAPFSNETLGEPQTTVTNQVVNVPCATPIQVSTGLEYTPSTENSVSIQATGGIPSQQQIPPRQNFQSSFYSFVTSITNAECSSIQETEEKQQQTERRQSLDDIEQMLLEDVAWNNQESDQVLAQQECQISYKPEQPVSIAVAPSTELLPNNVSNINSTLVETFLSNPGSSNASAAVFVASNTGQLIQTCNRVSDFTQYSTFPNDHKNSEEPQSKPDVVLSECKETQVDSESFEQMACSMDNGCEKLEDDLDNSQQPSSKSFVCKESQTVSEVISDCSVTDAISCINKQDVSCIETNMETVTKGLEQVLSSSVKSSCKEQETVTGSIVGTDSCTIPCKDMMVGTDGFEDTQFDVTKVSVLLTNAGVSAPEVHSNNQNIAAPVGNSVQNVCSVSNESVTSKCELPAGSKIIEVNAAECAQLMETGSILDDVNNNKHNALECVEQISSGSLNEESYNANCALSIEAGVACISPEQICISGCASQSRELAVVHHSPLNAENSVSSFSKETQVDEIFSDQMFDNTNSICDTSVMKTSQAVCPGGPYLVDSPCNVLNPDKASFDHVTSNQSSEKSSGSDPQCYNNLEGQNSICEMVLTATDFSCKGGKVDIALVDDGCNTVSELNTSCKEISSAGKEVILDHSVASDIAVQDSRVCCAGIANQCLTATNLSASVGDSINHQSHLFQNDSELNKQVVPSSSTKVDVNSVNISQGEAQCGYALNDLQNASSQIPKETYEENHCSNTNRMQSELKSNDGSNNDETHLEVHCNASKTQASSQCDSANTQDSFECRSEHSGSASMPVDEKGQSKQSIAGSNCHKINM